MKNYFRPIFASLYLLQLALQPIQSVPAQVDAGTAAHLLNIRTEGSNVILEMSQLMHYEVFDLSSPDRLVIEIPGMVYQTGFNKLNINGPLIRRIRGYQFKENPLISRVVIDLKDPVNYSTTANGNEITIALSRNEYLANQNKQAKKRKSPRIPKRRRDLLASMPKEVVTLDFEGADIRDVIRLMAETSNINIIFGPEVNGTISIHLKKVPFDEAFQTIMNLKGLVSTQLGGNILRVTTPDLLAKERSKAVMFTKTIPINYLKATDMQKHIQSVMASTGRKGTITVAQEINSIVITDSQEGIGQAERLIAQLDKKPKQVMIEARIVEINLNNGLDLGVQWEFAHQDVTAGTSGINRGDFFGLLNRDGDARISHVGTFEGGGGLSQDIGALSPGVAGTGVSLPGPTNAAITFGFVKNLTAFSATLAALVDQSKAKILSSPKVVTINGKEASIEAVQDIPFRTSTVSGTGVVSNSFQTVSAGIILTVTPTINAEDNIMLVIHPESSFPTQESTEAGPIIRTRSAKTTVIIKDGNTLVIGGLIDDQDTKGVSKVPLLGDLPIIGVFFRSQTTRKIRNELLVFVTPRIIRD